MKSVLKTLLLVCSCGVLTANAAGNTESHLNASYQFALIKFDRTSGATEVIDPDRNSGLDGFLKELESHGKVQIVDQQPISTGDEHVGHYSEWTEQSVVQHIGNTTKAVPQRFGFGINLRVATSPAFDPQNPSLLTYISVSQVVRRLDGSALGKDIAFSDELAAGQATSTFWDLDGARYYLVAELIKTQPYSYPSKF